MTLSHSKKLGVRFTERLSGHLSTRVLRDFASAEKQGQRDGCEVELRLTLESDDLDRLVTDEDHAARITGTVIAPALSTAPMPISEGTFQVSVLDHDQLTARAMRYRLRVRSPEGHTYFVRGDKFIHAHSVLHLWPETTTLSASVYHGDSASGRLVARGVLHVSPDDFAQQCRTAEVTGAGEDHDRLTSLIRFGRFLNGALFDTYSLIAAGPYFFHPNPAPRQKRPLRVVAPELHYFRTADGLDLKLTRYRGGTHGPVLLIPDLGVSSRIFALDTLETNLLEYLCARRYDVWLLDGRTSVDLPYVDSPYTADDVATKDLPAAVAEVRWKSAAADVQCVAHGFGALAFVQAMLAGLKDVRAAVLSQNAAHLVPPPRLHAQAGVFLPDLLDRVLADGQESAPWHEGLEERLLAAYPLLIGAGDANPVHRRIAFHYGQLFETGQLNKATYWDALHELFGVASLRCLEHIAAMVRAGHVVNAEGRNVYLPHVKRLAIPLLFLHGEKNRCWLPEGTHLTHDWLCRENGPELYDRRVLADYGHLDCLIGPHAVRDVYPFILEHLERTGR